MANPTGTLTEVKKALANLRIKNLLRGARRSQGISMLALDKRIGLKPGGVERNARNNNMRIHLLMALSTQLEMNLLEPYTIMLPEKVQVTERERQLKLQITTLEKQVADLTRERDLYKEIALNK